MNTSTTITNQKNLLTPFFHLLRYALWKKEFPLSLFSSLDPNDWEQLYQLARKQALLGLFFDAIQSLPNDLQPNAILLKKWMIQSQQIVNTNLKLNHTLQEIDDSFKANGIQAVLLKGQGLAQNYRNPLLRQPGDIDLYFPNTSAFSASKTWIMYQKIPLSEVIKHVSGKWNQVQIEFHEKLDGLHYPASNRKIQAFFKDCLDQEGEEKTYFSKTNLSLLPYEANVVYVMLHALNHFIAVGVGLRQFCDWALLVSTQQKAIDKDKMTALLQALGILRMANAFAQIQIDYLGCDPQWIPFHYSPEPLHEVLLQDVIRGGNFGFHRPERNRPSGKWTGKLYTAKVMTQRCLKFYSFSPKEMISYPIYYVLGDLRLILQGKM